MIEEAWKAQDEGRKVVLVPFNFPPEIVHMFESASVVSSEILTTLGVAALQGQGERYWDYAMGMGLPDFLCSANTIAVGSILSGDDFTPDVIVQMSPGSCDANSKIHEFVSHQFGIPQLIVEKPTDSGRRGREQYEKYFRAFIEQLQEFLGEELDEERMRDVAEKANHCTKLYYELWDLHKHVPCPVPNIFTLYAYSTRFTLWGRSEGVAAFEDYVHTVKEIMANGDYPAEERARSYWTYLPYFFDFAGFYDWLEKQGIVYLGDCLTLSFPSIIDTTDKESMITSLAENAWNMPMTRQMGGDSMSTHWLEDLTYSINDLGANCAIYCGHHSCKQTWSVVNIVRREIKSRTGVPTLILQGDSWMKRMTPISVLQEEISDFIRNVVERRSGRTRKKTGTNGG